MWIKMTIGMMVISTTLPLSKTVAQPATLYRIADKLDDAALNIRSSPNATGSDNIMGFLPEGHFFSGIQGDPSSGGWRQIPAQNRNGQRVKVYVNIGNKGQYANPPKSTEDTELWLDPQKLNPTSGATTLFSAPGYRFFDCVEPKCKKVGWPKGSSSLSLVSTQLQEIKDSNSPSGFAWENFYEVQNQHGKRGWIQGDYFLHDNENKPSSCAGHSRSCSPVQDLPKQVAKLREVVKAVGINIGSEQKMSRQIADTISSKMGKCLLSSKKDKLGRLTIPTSIASASGNTVDKALFPHWSAQQSTIKIAVKGSGKVSKNISLSQKDLFAIDTLARTMYGEMAKCDRKHGHNAYSTAVAAMANNRRLAIEKKINGAIRFDRPSPRNKLATALTDVLSSKSQFSVWNFDEDALRIALCPPADSKTTFWQGHPPEQQYVDIWHNILATAVEAHVFPDQFRQRTSSVNGYFYTSRIDWKSSFSDNKEAQDKISEMEPPTIDGIKLRDRTCLRFWQESSVSNLKPET